MAWARKALPAAAVSISVCTGAFVLGKAGLLDGHSKKAAAGMPFTATMLPSAASRALLAGLWGNTWPSMGIRMRRVRALQLLFAFPLMASASSGVDGAELLTIRSTVLGEERVFAVVTPTTYSRSQERYPVLYLTDGDAHLGHAQATAEFLARNDLMPEVILVGIPNTSRSRDLTPTPGTAEERAAFPGSGGGERFLDFIEHELVPAVDARYRTVPSRLYAGHSLGGLLGIHALLTRPGLFQAVVAASPSLAWDDALLLREARALKGGGALGPRSLYVTLGGHEASPRGLEGFRTFAKVMRTIPWPNFDWTWQVLPEEDHGSGVLLAYYFGLRHVFEGWRMPEEVQEGGLASLATVLAHYKGLSSRWGYHITPPETLVNQLGYDALQRRATGEALDLFRFNVASHPDSANAYDSLGVALQRADQLAAARESYRQAVQLAEKSADPSLNVLRAHFESVDERFRTR
jgi:predicted alpha/beta superfamily hydrolase